MNGNAEYQIQKLQKPNQRTINSVLEVTLQLHCCFPQMKISFLPKMEKEQLNCLQHEKLSP